MSPRRLTLYDSLTLGHPPSEPTHRSGYPLRLFTLRWFLFGKEVT